MAIPVADIIDTDYSQKPNRLYLFLRKQSIMAKFFTALLALALAGSAASFSMSMSSSTDRRAFVKTAGTAGAAVAAGTILNTPAASADADVAVEVDKDGFITSESGLKYKVTKEGTGAIPAAGQTVKVSKPRSDLRGSKRQIVSRTAGVWSRHHTLSCWTK